MSPTRPERRADWREKTRPTQPLQQHFREKVRPTPPLQPHFREKVRPTPPLHWHFREKVRPASVKTPILGCFERAGRTISRSHPPPDHAGRTFSHTRRNNMATLKPTTPLRVPEQQPLKPPSPLRPKTAPKNTDFAPAKVMAVSIPHRYQRAKAMAVSDKRATWPTGPGCGTRGRRRTLAGRPVGGRRYKRRQTNTIPITSREPL